MKGMKYAIMCSALSLVFYYHNLMIGGGFWGYMPASSIFSSIARTVRSLRSDASRRRF